MVLVFKASMQASMPSWWWIFAPSHLQKVYTTTTYCAVLNKQYSKPRKPAGIGLFLPSSKYFFDAVSTV